MFEQGDKALIDLAWFERNRVNYVSLGVTSRVTVESPSTTPSSTTDTMGLPEGTRWCLVTCDETAIQLDVPEHLLNRSLNAEVAEKPKWQVEQEARDAAPITRLNPDDLLDKGELPRDVRDALGAALLEMEIDWRGHFCNGSEWDSEDWYEDEPERRKEMLTQNFGTGYDKHVKLQAEDAEVILAAHNAGEPLDRFILVVTATTYFCPNCVESEYRQEQVFETDGVTLRLTEECPSPEALITEWTMNFPSGKVIIDDDLRSLCRIASNRNINRRIGTHLQILDHAAEGLTVGFGIGNTCPSVFKVGDGRYEIGSKQKRVWRIPRADHPAPPPNLMPEDPEEPDTEFWWVDVQPKSRTGEYDHNGDDSVDDRPEGVTEVCSVCTDLWAYSIIDLEDAKLRAAYYGLDLDKATENWSVNIVDIEPGTYRFRHFHGADRDAHNVVMATFERIGDATEIVDWPALDAAFQVHITQAVQVNLRKWPTLYAEDGSQEWADQCARVIASELRGGVPDRDWHVNGFRLDYRRADIEGLPIREIPRFRFQHGWEIGRSFIDTTATGKDELFGGDVLFNESYALAAGHVLESAISFGLPTRRNTHSKPGEEGYDTYNVEAKRKEMSKAAKLWEGLTKRYPHVAEAMPEFTAWMSRPVAVQLWIDNFDLGPEVFDRAAHDAKAAERQAERDARHILHYMVNNIGTEVVFLDGPNEAVVGVVAEPEAKPDHVFVQFAVEEGDDDLREVPLIQLGLTPKSKAARDARLAKSKVDYKQMMAELMAELD